MCSKILWCSHWTSSHLTFEENVHNRIFNCSLLSSCSYQHVGNTTYPTVINSGSRICLPDPFKRRPCRPGCPAARRFCHGRCVAGGRGCFFAPCSRSPYRETPGSTCAQLALEESQEGNCRTQCCYLATDEGAAACQQCLEENIPASCQDLSGAGCWSCGGPVLEIWRKCSESNLTAVDTINCIISNLLPSCSTCVCTLLCYWSPSDDLCRSCLDKPQLSSLFLHHQRCPQGSVYSSSSSTCLKAFTSKKIWSEASRHCQYSGGHLAQPRDNRSTQAVLEAINLQASSEEFYLGAKESVEIKGAGISGNSGVDTPTFLWTSDSSAVEDVNWAEGYPVPGTLITNFICF